MNKSKFRYISLALTVMLLLSAVLPGNVLGASAGGSSQTIVTVAPGIGKIDVNGVSLPSEKPYLSGKTLYVPLRTVMEAFGADVLWLDGSSLNVLFKNVSAELKIGRTDYLKNQAEEKLTAPPVIKATTVMVPSDFITGAFDIAQSTKAATGETSFTLENDGSLTDLSFLTGGLNKPGAGNSYFGWSISLPKGSRIAAQSFNSKSVQFENDYHHIAIDVTVGLTEGETLEEHYGKLREDPYEELKAELIDSRLEKDPKQAFIELLYTDAYDEAVYHRIYSKDGYFINIIITSADESDPDILKKDKAVADMLASFRLDYKGGVQDISDLSRVSYGLAGYSNYITSGNSGKKYMPWEMSILPEWDLLQTNSGSPYITEFGASPKEYVSIEVSPAGDGTAEQAGKKLESDYNTNFNPALFSIKKSASSEVAGISAWSILFEVKTGKTQYTYDERLLVSGGLTYDITFKLPSAEYEKKKESLENMLNTFKPYAKDTEELCAEIDKYKFNNEKNRLGKDDRPVLSENKAFLWSVSVPGRWQKNSLPGQSMDTFYDQASGGIITVESVSRKAASAGKPDAEKFRSMSMVSDMDLEPVSVNSIQDKGRTVKVYKYRIDDEDSDNYADIYYYILEGADYSYCYMSSISDLSSSKANLNAMAAAWASFTILEKDGDK